MKNTKLTNSALRGFMLVLLAGLVIFAAGGCGGSSHHSSNSGNSDEVDEVTASILEKIFEQDEDGSPMVFDYAPQTSSHDASAKPDSNTHFVKYISPKDLNANYEFVTSLNLNKDSEYIIKYSRGGRSLNDASLGLRITAPDGREMILDLLGLGAAEVIDDVISDDAKDSSDLTAEELAKEIALENNAAAETEATEFYVDTDFEPIPAENPCVILYRFKAPASGKYEFNISELRLNASGDAVTDPDPEGVLFEFRLYGYEAAHTVFDNLDSLDIELTPEDIIDIQRIVLDGAEEFNDNGLPVNVEPAFDDEETDETEFEAAASGAQVRIAAVPINQIAFKFGSQRVGVSGQVIPQAVINNVPYDNLFEEGAGFYAHSGLRAVTNVVDDNAFSKSAIRKFMASKPGAGAVSEKFNVDVIATEAEHDRSAQLAGMTSFVLLRDAFNRTQRRDQARLGSDFTRIISVRYELAENEPRTIDPNKVQLEEEALDELKKNGGDAFTKKYGDYFVAGYTWGLRYEATVELIADSVNAEFGGYLDNDPRKVSISSPERVCELASARIKTALENAHINTVSERDTGKSSQDALDKMNKALTSLENDFKNVTITVTHSKHTGQGSEQSFSLRGFTNNLTAYIKSAKGVNKSKYEQLYASLRRYREIKEAKPYISEALSIDPELYRAIRLLTEIIFKTRCYYNSLMVIPAANLRGGKGLQDSWQQEFEVNLITKVDTGLNYICADKARVWDYYSKCTQLYNKYKALAERYNFYAYFVKVKKNTRSPSWNDSDSDSDLTCFEGIHSYNKGKIVLEDMKAGGSRYHHHEEPWYKGPRGADFEGSYSTSRVYWFKTGYRNTNHCKGRDVNGETLGKKSYHWRYDGAGSRRCEVFLELKFIDMPDDKYPFAGLE